MNYGLVGHGTMGRAIDASAAARGHRRRVIVDRGGKITAARFRGVDVAFEFTEPAAARANVLTLLAQGVSVVCGTTGWDAADPEIRKTARRAKAGVVIAPNFSVGMNLFYVLLEQAARNYLAVGGFLHCSGRRAPASWKRASCCATRLRSIRTMPPPMRRSQRPITLPP